MVLNPDTLLFIGGIIFVIWMLMKKPAKYPPGPPKWPIFGNLLQLTENKQILPAMQKMHKKYGEVVGMFAANNPVVLISGLDAIREACSREDMTGRPENKFLKMMSDGKIYGFTSASGEQWKEQRRFTLHHLRNLGFGKRSLEGVAHDEILSFFSDIERASGGIKRGFPTPIRLRDYMMSGNLNILWHIMSGVRYKSEDAEFKKIVNGFITYFELVGPDGGMINAFPLIAKYFPFLTPLQKIKPAYDEFFRFLQDTIDEHEKTLDHNHPRDFIDIYLMEIEKHKGEPGSTYHDKNLRQICAELFVAGTDTSMNTLDFGLLYMVLFPEVQKKVQQEIDEVVGNDRLPVLDDRSKLPYIEATLSEIFRLSSIGPMSIPHAPYTNKKEISFRGYEIPKNARILLNLFDLHHDPELWEKPFECMPERFLSESGKFIRNDALVPFGTGKRYCPGESLARNNVFLFFSSIMQRYSLSIPDGEPKPTMKSQGNLILLPREYRVKIKLRI